MGQLKATNMEVEHESESQENDIVVNTCGFIDNAKEESVNTILDFVKRKEEGSVESFCYGLLVRAL